ncbi:Probable UDP-N-acetylglucosamine--peptide N-acetylglucosaminyltransferase SPINDLY (LeSPY) [Durusdinium trenchii]|uniref:Probable UDP-N-acetylglucosamine--peptide N-acetylglucosaminyltransferase SPINDLY (LeSPY) n=1 Tax=Durusdinium trenchii TaxID=1381693 RepID=A0ABP0IWK4_9DINO
MAQAAVQAANALRARGRFSEAVAQYAAAAELQPKLERRAAFLVQKGAAHLGAGQREEARRCLDEATRLEPENAAAWFKRGDVCKSAKELDEAARSFRKAIRRDPRMDAAKVSLVRVLMMQGDLEAALGEAQKALPSVESKRSSLLRLVLLCCAHLGRELEAQGAVRELVQEVQAARKANLLSGGDARKQELDDQTHAVLLSTLQTLAQQTRDLEFHKLACVVEPSFDLVLQLGVACMEQGAETRGDGDRTKTCSPKMAAQARRVLRLARRMDPEDWRSDYFLGLLEFKQQRYRASASHFLESLSLTNKTPPPSPKGTGSPPAPNANNKGRSEASWYAFEGASRDGHEELLQREMQGRMASRVQLCLGVALLNAGDLAAARHHVSCAAYSRGAVRNFAQILVAVLDLRAGNKEAAMHSLNIVRKEVHEAVLQPRARSMSHQHRAAFVSHEHERGPPSDQVLGRVCKLHWDTARVARLVGAGLQEILDADPPTLGPREVEKHAGRLKKVLELERSCLQDILMCEPESDDARAGMERVDRDLARAAKAASPSKSQRPMLRRAVSYQAPISRPGSGGEEGEHDGTQSFNMRHNGDGLNSAAKLKLYAEQEAKRREFLRSLSARRAALEHDEAHSDISDLSD